MIAARHHVGAPGDGVPGAVRRDPLVHQRAAIGAGDAGVGRAQMSQPAEAEKRCRPLLGRRGDLERRAGIADHHLAGKDKASGIDFAGPGGVGGAQVLRRDQQVVSLAEGEGPVEQGMREDAAEQPPSEAARQEHGQSGLLRDRNARHRGAGSSSSRYAHRRVRQSLPASAREHSERPRPGQPRITCSNPLQACRKEAVEARPARIRIGKVARQRLQVAIGGQPFRAAVELGGRDRLSAQARISSSRSRTTSTPSSGSSEQVQ